MKRIVSVSIGSSKRNATATLSVLGEDVEISRVGTDGDIERAIEIIGELDGKVDAFGMGGIDLYIYHGNRRYVFRDAKRIARAAKVTPMVDGSGLKNTLERRVVEQLAQTRPDIIQKRNILMVCAMDRFGMAEALEALECRVLYGDLMFALGLPLPLYKLSHLGALTRVLAPIVVQLPISMLYPVGAKQETTNGSHRFGKYYQWADVIAGDFHMIRKHLPPRIEGKTVITNTVTASDVDLLQRAGVRRLITTTPSIEGRSFGTNVMEGLIVSLVGKPVSDITAADYQDMLDRIAFAPRVEEFA